MYKNLPTQKTYANYQNNTETKIKSKGVLNSYKFNKTKKKKFTYKNERE